MKQKNDLILTSDQETNITLDKKQNFKKPEIFLFLNKE
jgi:hypothetical protein